MFAEKPAGFIAWRTMPASVAADAWEMKRLWVRPAARGLGLGRALTQAVLDRAVGPPQGRLSRHRSSLDGSCSSALLGLGFALVLCYNENSVDGIAYLVKYL